MRLPSEASADAPLHERWDECGDACVGVIREGGLDLRLDQRGIHPIAQLAP
jgi:hypothetical protein